MKRLASTLALLAVLIGLGSYIYFTGAQPTDTAEAKDKLFPGLEAAKLEELKVKSASGDVTTLKKENGTWALAAPIAAAAAETDSTAIANALADIQIERVVDEAPADLKEYGLDAPPIAIDFKGDGGKATGRMLVGVKTATGGNLYAKRDDEKRVVLIAQYHESALNKSTFDLRDKTILKVDKPKVESITVDLAGKVATFKKNGSDWALTAPLATRADSPFVEGLLDRIEMTQMKSIVTTAPSADDLKKYGFDKPQAVITLTLGSERRTVTLGGAADETSVYLREGSKPDVYTVDNSSGDDLKKPIDDYRKKELFDMRAFNATHVELSRGGQTVVLDRVKATEEGKPDTWKRASPNAADADREKVERLLAGLADIRAVSFVTSRNGTGLDKPALSVLAKFDEGKKEERVTLGKAGSDAYGVRADDPGIAKVDATKVDEMLTLLDEIAK